MPVRMVEMLSRVNLPLNLLPFSQRRHRTTQEEFDAHKRWWLSNGAGRQSQQRPDIAYRRGAQRSARRQRATGWPDKEIMSTLPEMRRGQVAAALVKIAVDMERPGAVIPGGPRSDHLAYALGQGQMAYYHILQTTGEARLLRTRGEFRAPTWPSGPRRSTSKTCRRASFWAWRAPVLSCGWSGSTNGTSKA